MKRFVFLLLIFLPGVCLFGGSGPGVDRIISDYNNLRSIRASIRQQVSMPGGGMEFYIGDYYADNKGRLRIDYTVPERSVVINSSEGLSWYYPERKKVYVKKKSGTGIEYSGISTIMLIDDSRSDITLSYDGMEFYSFFKRAAVYTIKSSHSSNVIKIWTDPEGLYVLRRYVLDSTGREIIREIWSGHVYTGGVYIPSRIEMYVRTYSGVVHTVTVYSDIVVNSAMNDELFRFREGKGFEVMELDEMLD